MDVNGDGGFELSEISRCETQVQFLDVAVVYFD